MRCANIPSIITTRVNYLRFCSDKPANLLIAIHPLMGSEGSWGVMKPRDLFFSERANSTQKIVNVKTNKGTENKPADLLIAIHPLMGSEGSWDVMKPRDLFFPWTCQFVSEDSER
ncbi:hypothetical protein CDAR_120321 [Caerostris darwini]|uniref:Uncharacterized protein n=1 Tax=Caerostris darwini TaxID=1538125 RepID=A0AAV4TCA9_9ARAC|nr:hypothetical protein CDAR_120321 [Caerostris darwini]